MVRQPLTLKRAAKPKLERRRVVIPPRKPIVLERAGLARLFADADDDGAAFAARQHDK